MTILRPFLYVDKHGVQEVLEIIARDANMAKIERPNLQFKLDISKFSNTEYHVLPIVRLSDAMVGEVVENNSGIIYSLITGRFRYTTTYHTYILDEYYTNKKLYIIRSISN